MSDYNAKVAAAVAHMNSKKESFVIKEKGRHHNEEAFVLMRSNVYAGYGFIEKDVELHSYADLEAFIVAQKNTVETDSILKSYLARNPDKRGKALHEGALESNA